MLAIGFIFYLTKSVDFSTIFALNYILKESFINIFGISINVINIICFLLFIGCIGKSAQIGLHT